MEQAEQHVAKVAAASGSAVEKPADGRRDRNVARLGTSDGRRVSRMPGRGWTAGGNSQRTRRINAIRTARASATPHRARSASLSQKRMRKRLSRPTRKRGEEACVSERDPASVETE